MNTWSAAGNLASPRSDHTAALLPNGKVLIVGGVDSAGNSLATAELYDPRTNTWSSTGNLAARRESQSETLLPNGQVLVTGGADTDGTAWATAELFTLGTTATPTFNPVAGPYTGAQSVTIACATSGSIIYYTTDGSTPTASSTHYTGAITVNATMTLKAIAIASGNYDSAVASAAYTLPPVITSATTATGILGQTFSYQIAATNIPASFNATGLPAWAAVDTGTGIISGTPNAAVTTNVTISATNLAGTGSATLKLTINLPPPPVINSPTAVTGTEGLAFSYQITATSNPTSFHATGLPSWAAVDSGTGIISGTPDALGTTNVTISATNPGGTSAAVTLAITVIPQPPTFSPPPDNYTSIQSVSLACATSNANIYYTLDGATPTSTSTPFTTPIRIAQTTTIMAVAVVPGFSGSAVASATYTMITPSLSGVTASPNPAVQGTAVSLAPRPPLLWFRPWFRRGISATIAPPPTAVP